MCTITKISTPFVLFCIALCGLLPSSVICAESADIEPEADKILKQMSEYLAGVKQFSVINHATIETMLDSGQKIMLDHNSHASVSRPDKFFSTRKGDAVEQSFYYNGKTFTLYNHSKNFYASVDAPSNLPDALNEAKDKFDITAPGLDILYKDSYERLSNGLISGFYVDKGMIDGVECHHLAFRNADVDWQIWIQSGDKPLPKRYVITSRWITGAPQFSLNMAWDTEPDFSNDIFNFIVPEKAEKIELLSQSTSN